MTWATTTRAVRRLWRGAAETGGLQGAVLAPLVALLVALLAGNLLVLAYGESPARVFGLMLAGTWGNPYGIGQVLFKATPLIFTGLAVALPFRAGLFNIGAEGQVALGALATGLVGAALPAGTPWPVALPLCAAAGFAVGAAWGAVPGLLRARFGAHEVVTGIMLNFLGLALVNYLVVACFALPETVHTALVAPGARLERLGAFLPALHGSAASTAFFWALCAAVASGWLLFRTGLGYELRATGLNARAAQAAGIPFGRIAVVAMGLAGGLSGLCATSYVQGFKYYFEDGMSAGVGFMGLAVALLGRNHPLGVVLAALLFGTLSQGGLAVNAIVPKEIVDVLQAIVILAALATSQELRRTIGDAVRRSGGGGDA
jgi:simple sugar transport system permease protein